jgi:hypothetical protein
MDAAGGLCSRLMCLPLRAVCLRWCGRRGVETLEDVALVASTASSSQANSQASSLDWPFRLPTSTPAPIRGDPGTRVRSRFLERVLEQPLLQARAARLAAQRAAQAAQVLFAL